MKSLLKIAVKNAVSELYQNEVDDKLIQLQQTRKEFEGDLTLVVFPLLRISKKKPEETAQQIGDWLVEHTDEVDAYSVIKGFLNISMSNAFWIDFISKNILIDSYGQGNPEGHKPLVIEFSSPNTNKPLHLGHIRNNLLGDSISRILDFYGHTLKRVNLINDRGIHICKSMLAWKRWGENENPASSGIKGDHLVGKYYVLFDKKYKEEQEALIADGMDKDTAKKEAPLLKEAQEMLRKWEAGDDEVRAHWKEMNGWVYHGFEQTYQRLGIKFDKLYYESNTYLLGKEIVVKGLQDKLFVKKDDGSVWADLSNMKLDEKILLRADGTSVYITQDLGTSQLRYDDFDPEKLIYVVGNEQIYHFDVLKALLKTLNKPFADQVYHLSYGMVELPEGKMKSREGTVVDADDLMDEMYQTARNTSEELGKLSDYTDKEKASLFEMLGLGALKYFILKVDPKKNMLFDPAESIDFNGNTGPFIQYTHARIRSVIRKSGREESSLGEIPSVELNDAERSVLRIIQRFPAVVEESAENYSPALIANYVFELAKEFNHLYQEHSILHEEDKDKSTLRLSLAYFCSKIIARSMSLLGVDVPERM